MAKKTVAKRVAQIVGIVVAVIVAVVLIYALYLQLTYYRIADNQELDVVSNQTAELTVDESYTAVTYNLGFGAYTPDYTFFMDEGVMADGTETQGNRARAESRESVEACTQGDIEVVQNLDPDFILLQEVDTDSDRSYHVNQVQSFIDAFPGYASVFASNFHSAYLAYPLYEPHGSVNSGLLTLSDKQINSAVRRSYPVDESFPTKFFDLDRCFEVMRIPVDNGRELVLINSHMSAYDEGGTVRTQQLAMLNDLLKQEADAGNYVICGGDWNHALSGSVDIYPSQQQVPDWVSVLNDGDLAEGYSVVPASNIADVPTCRGDDIPYEKGVTYTTTVDGFIVSSNVEAMAENIDTGFATSDHNPVQLSFRLRA
ncbi:MAG: endonuclease/exonuclease/phosphatase family protein [Eggerthellaceae bacterium]|jgi:endonuclease/exonuclease/phosphatase family metal-dependent hydrolase